MFGGSAARHLHSTPLKHATPSKQVEMSPMDRLKSVKGEAYQGNYLINAKERHSEKKNHHALQHQSSNAGSSTASSSYSRKSTSSHGVRYTVTNGSHTAASRHHGHQGTHHSAVKATHGYY